MGCREGVGNGSGERVGGSVLMWLLCVARFVCIQTRSLGRRGAGGRHAGGSDEDVEAVGEGPKKRQQRSVTQVRDMFRRGSDEGDSEGKGRWCRGSGIVG